MSALKFRKARPGLYTAQRNDHAYEIEKVADFGWQLRHGSPDQVARGERLDPLGGFSPRLGMAKHLALQHLTANV